MMQTEVTTEQLIKAIAKYLSPDWTAEEPILREMRRKIASHAVPIFLAQAPSPVTPTTIEDYVTLLSDAPESEQGRRAINYLVSVRSTWNGPPFIHTIADDTRKAYINERILGLIDDEAVKQLIGRQLYFYNGEVSVSEVKLNWEEIRTTFPVDSVITAAYYHPLDLASQFLQRPPAEISTKMDANQVIEAAVSEARRKMLQSFDEAVASSRKDGFNIHISVQFPEGGYGRNELRLTSYTPRLEPMLYKLLEMKQ